MYCVYEHIRLDKNEPFYIGVGKFHKGKNRYNRPYDISGRNIIWKRIVDKTEYKINILYQDVTKEIASKKEKELINLYGRICNKTGILANLNTGGYEGYEHNRRRQVSCYKLTGEYVETFNSLIDAVHKYGGSTGCLHDVLNNKKGSTANLQWRYGNDINNIEKYSKFSTLKYKNRKIEQWSLDEKTLINTFDTVSEAHINTNIHLGNIWDICMKRKIKKINKKNPQVRKSAGGYKWKFKYI